MSPRYPIPPDTVTAPVAPSRIVPVQTGLHVAAPQPAAANANSEWTFGDPTRTRPFAIATVKLIEPSPMDARQSGSQDSAPQPSAANTDRLPSVPPMNMRPF